MAFREYGQDPNKTGIMGYLPYAAGAVAVGAGVLFSKQYALKQIERGASKGISEAISTIANKDLRTVAESNLKNILLDKNISYREAITTALGNNPVMDMWAKAGKYLWPVGLMDSVLKLPELRLAAQNKVLRLSGNELITDNIKNFDKLIYARGSIYNLGFDKGKAAFKKVVDDVYPTSAGLGYLLEKIHREVPKQEVSGVMGFIKDKLDIGNVKKPNESFFKGVLRGIKDTFGLTTYEDKKTVQFLKPAHPLKDLKSFAQDVYNLEFKKAVSRLSPGRSILGANMPTDSMKDISVFHLMPYHMLNRMNQQFAKQPGLHYLALSDKSTRSFADLYLSMGLKRVLPAFLGLEALKYVNYETGKLTGKDLEERWGDIKANASLDAAYVGDIFGASRFVKRLNKIAPEATSYVLDPFNDTPAGQTYEERKEYLLNGREAIHKNRWWLFGSSSPFRGEKIEYFTPSWYQRSKPEWKDYQYTDTLYGSKEEYWKHSWLPTPRYPFAPVTRLLDPYYLEKKHYYDRPYPVTGKMFSENIFGEVLNLTVGNILKPQKAMHQKEVSSAIRTVGNINDEIRSRFYEQSQRQHKMYITGGGRSIVSDVIPIPGSQGSLPHGGIASSFYDAKESEYASYGGPDEFSEIRNQNVSLSAGNAVGPYSYRSEKQDVRGILENVNSIISYSGYRHQIGVPGRVTKQSVLTPTKYPSPEFVSGPIKHEYEMLGMKSSVSRSITKAYESIREVGGLYGFLADQAIDKVGLKPHGVPVLESSQLGSFSRWFYKDSGLGGIGGEFSEIVRRFIPKVKYEDVNINPIKNMMPSWMPHNYGIDFYRSDPYMKVPLGELRMPGAAHEKAYGFDPMRMSIGASMVGADQHELVQYFLGMREGTTYTQEKIMEAGDVAHARLQKQLEQQGISFKSEMPIYNDILRSSGRIDAVIRTENGVAPLEIKSKRGDVVRDMTGPEQKHVEQLTMYMATVGSDFGYLHYTDRDNPIHGETKIFKVNYDPELYQNIVTKVENARNVVREMVQNRVITPQELYSPLERFRVLADVAPFSAEYDYYSRFLSKTLDAGSKDKEEFQRIKEESREVKKKIHVEPYRFKYSDIATQKVVVSKVLAPGVFQALGYNGPLRLAGVKVTKDSKEALDSLIHPGAVLTVGYAKNKDNRVENDTWGSTHAAVWTLGGTNVAKELMNTGYAEEKEDDYRPAAIHSRFSDSEIAFGKATEWVSHWNIPYLHNKFMPVDSPLEEYKRKDIYGKRFTRWSKPVESMLIPAVRTYAEQHPVTGALEGGFLGWVMGAMKHDGKTLVEKLSYKNKAAAIGAAIGLSAGILMRLAGSSKKAYIPGDIKHRRDLDEYYDRLKYIKFRRLYEAARRNIKKTEGIDIEALMRAVETKGQSNMERKRNLEALKRRDKVEGIDTADINEEIKEIVNSRRTLDLSPMDSLALQFRQQYKSTMHGLDETSSYSDMYKAVPGVEKEYLQYFLEAPAEERKEISRLVPEDMRKLLEAKWYGKVYETKPLDGYFRDKFIPPTDWAGWLPERALDDYKMASLKADGYDVREAGFWDSDEKRAQELNVKDIQPFKVSGFKQLIGQNIRSMYKGLGMDDVIVNIYTMPADSPGVSVNVDVMQDREEQIREYVHSNGYKVFGDDQ